MGSTQGDMPYTLDQNDDGKWCIYDKATGKKVKGAEFATRPDAMKKLRALLKAMPPEKETAELEDDSEDDE